MTPIPKKVRKKLFRLQPRCMECGGPGQHPHHRIFRSETELGLMKFLDRVLPEHNTTTGSKLVPWSMNDLQNLVCLCAVCHIQKLHSGWGGNSKALRVKYRMSYTDPETGFNIPYECE